jgi:phosphatidate phosphatase PAH1
LRLFIFVLLVALGAEAQEFRVCASGTLPVDLPVEGFRHKRNSLASHFKARHSINDALVALGSQAHLEGKFIFGLISKSLNDEVVEVWIDSCEGPLKRLHRGLTAPSGKLVYTTPTEFFKAPGLYKMWMRVAGDGTAVSANVRVVAKNTKIAVFDVDGTLTSHESDVTLGIISELLRGCFAPPKRAYGPELTRYLHDKLGYEIVYLSGRHYFLNDLTRSWLARNEFAPGTLMVTQSFFEILPKEKSVGQFKQSQLGKIKGSGIVLDRAYGNAQTDIVSYQKAGISDNRIYLVGQHSGSFGAVPLGNDFTKHYEELSRIVD